jgi:hypothetical protein
MQSHFEENAKPALIRLRTKLGINKLLRQWGKQYQSRLPHAFPAVPKEMLEEVVAEMIAEGLITIETSERGRPDLVYREVHS